MNLDTKEALKSLLAHLPFGKTQTEEVYLEEAVGRVLAEEVAAIMDDPPYSQATADGYVMLASGTALASLRRPITFEVQGDIPPVSSAAELSEGRALRVKNGGYMSIKRFLEGHYAVLKESETKEISGTVSVARRIEKHENISVQGTFLKTGNTIFGKGYRIHSRDIATLAGQGVLKVVVAVPKKVALFSIGDDLLSPTKPYKIGYKYDGISYGLAAMIKAAGGLPDFRGIVPCQLTPFARKLSQAISEKEVDIVVMSGGTSAEGRPFTVDVVNGAGIVGLSDTEAIVESMKCVVVAADKISPNVLAVIGKKPVISISGQKEDAAQGFRTFVRPVISHLLGESAHSL